MKVLLITEYFPPIIHGGGEIGAEALATELAKRGIKVHVLTSKAKDLQRYEEKDNVIIHRLLKTGQNPRKLSDNIKRSLILHSSIKKEATNLHNKEKFNLIHFLNTTSITNLKNIKVKKIATINNYTNFCPKSNLYCIKGSFRPGEKSFVKYIKNMLNSDYIGKQKLRFYLKYNPAFLAVFYLNYLKRRDQIKYVDRFIVLNDIIKLRNSKKIYNVVKIKTRLIYFPIELDPNKMIITYIGELEEIKGIDTLIKAFSKTKDAVLLIVGSGSEEEKLKKLCEDLGIKEKVIFIGKVDQKYLPYIYSKTDIVALPTKWPEPLSRTLTEALFFRKPIVATDIGGNKEQVKHNINGFLIKNEQELAEKLDILIKNKILRQVMGDKSREIYEEKFIPDILIEKIIRMYKE